MVTSRENFLLDYRLAVFDQKAQQSLYMPGLALKLRLPNLQVVVVRLSTLRTDRLRHFDTLGKVFQNLNKRIPVCLGVKGDQLQHRL